MKGLFTKLVIFFTMGILFSSLQAFASSPINLQLPPKETKSDPAIPRPIIFPEDFFTKDFAGNAGMDLVVPEYLYRNLDSALSVASVEGPFLTAIMGMRNNDVLTSSPGPDTFFNIKYDFTKNYTFQVALGNFDGDPVANDILVVTSGGIQICRNYDDTTGKCANTLATTPFNNIDVTSIDPNGLQPMPWHAVVYNHDGDNRSDIAVIGFSSDNKGYLALFKTNPPPANPTDPIVLTQADVKQTTGLPLSLAAGKFDGDANVDVVVSQMPTGPGSAILSFFKNNGTTFNAPASPPGTFSLANCYAPTGTVSYNSDGNLVITCLLKSSSNDPGSVYLIKNEGAPNFSVQQELDAATHGFKGPYSTAVGDLNGDGAAKPDLAIADFGGEAIVTFAGTDASHVDPASRTTLPVGKYNPKFVQIVDMNADGSNDVTVVAGALMAFPLQQKVGTAETESKVAVAPSNQGVLVLLNYHPNIKINLPTACNQATVKVTCEPSPGKTINDCKLDSTVGGWTPVSTSALTDEGGGVKSFTFTVPNTAGAYKGTIKAVEAPPSGNTYTQDFEFDFKACATCPTGADANLAPVKVFWDDEWKVGPPPSLTAAGISAGSGIVYNQTEPSTPNIFSDFSSRLMTQLASVSGDGSMHGRFNPKAVGYYNNVVVRGTYSINGNTCGNWELDYLGPTTTGGSDGGMKCSFSPVPVTDGGILSSMALAGLPFVTMVLSRFKKRKKS